MSEKKATKAAVGLVKRLLKGKAIEQIKEFLRFHPGSEKDVMSAFAAQLNELAGAAAALGAVSVSAVQDLFKTAFTAPPRSRGHFFPDWSGICKGVNKMIKQIKGDIKQGKVEGHSAVMLEFFRQVAELGAADPPTEDDFLRAQGICQEMAELLQALAALPAISQAEKRKMVEVLESCASSRAFVYYGVCNIQEFLPAVVAAALPPAEALAYVRALLDKSTSDYVKSCCTSAEADILRKLGKEQEAAGLMFRHVDNFQVLGKELHRLVHREQDYDAALTLSEHALRALDENNEYMRNRLHECRLYIFDRLRNPEAAAVELRVLFVGEGGVKKYYDRLKKHVPTQDWPAFYEKLIADTLSGCESANDEQLAEIYAEEKDFERLSNVLMADSYDWFSLVKKYAPCLPEPYHAPLLVRALEKIKRFSQFATTRREYVELAFAMRSSKAICGGTAAMESLAAELRAKYARRPALVQELDGI